MGLSYTHIPLPAPDLKDSVDLGEAQGEGLVTEERGREISLDQSLLGVILRMAGALGQWGVLGKSAGGRKVGTACTDQQPVC